jgi:hypothetical protein
MVNLLLKFLKKIKNLIGLKTCKDTLPRDFLFMVFQNGPFYRAQTLGAFV